MAFSIDGALRTLAPLILFLCVLVPYAMFVFKFFRLVAIKDLLDIDLFPENSYNVTFLRRVLRALWFIVLHFIAFPLFVFLWFVILALLLALFAKHPSGESILLVSMAIVAAVRITAYYEEELALDLSRLLPFGLLGIVFVSGVHLSLTDAMAKVQEIVASWEALVYYLCFVILLEAGLRAFTALAARGTD